MKNTGEFWSLPKVVAERGDLGMADKLVFAILWTRRNGENEAWPSQENMAAQLGISVRAVRGSVGTLERVGLLTKTRSDRTKSNRYVVMDGDRQNLPVNDERQNLPVREAKNVKNEGQDLPVKRTVEENSEKNRMTPADHMRIFVGDVETKQGSYKAVVEYLSERGIPEQVVDQELIKFISYWTEPTKSGRKERWELQPTFDVRRRLATWFSNVRKFSGSRETKGVRI